MASQSSEERNRLRLRAWEQRNQETSQAAELASENVPLFGVPYKTNKGDELSNRIQRMLGSYEDVNNPYTFSIEPLPIPTSVSFSQSDRGPPNPDKPTKPPFHNQVHDMSAQILKSLSSNGCPSQPLRKSAASSSPNHCGHSSTFSTDCLSNSQLSPSAHQQKRSEVHSDLSEYVSLSHPISPQSPDAKPLPFPHSSDHDNNGEDIKEMDASTFKLKQSPGDVSVLQANVGNALPSQTFPSLLLSKQPSVVMTRKPTAYVRPMDGQDQVVSESPELKSSPEPYVPLSELINKSDLCRTKILSPFLEEKSDEVLCVKDILREMTQTWPPLLITLHTPSTNEPSKSLLQVKEEEQVSSCPGQKTCESSPADPSQLVQQGSPASFEAAHSRGVESASSSDSESSSRSESESEGTIEEPPHLPVSNVKTEPDGPAVAQVDWQLGNWIRSSQQNSSAKSQSGAHASRSPAPSRPPPSQSSQLSVSAEVVDPNRESKPQLSPHQREFADRLVRLQQHSKSSQDNYNHQSSQRLNSCSSSRNLSFNKNSSIPEVAACPDRSEAPIVVKCEEVVATQDKDTRFPDRPKVKTKTGRSKRSKDNGDPKRDRNRTSKHALLDKRKAVEEPEGAVGLCGHCPSCGVQYPIPCSCPTQSHARPDQLLPARLLKISSNKEPETICKRGTKTPLKTTIKSSDKTEQTARSSRDSHRPPRSLLVKIDLRLLSRVPPTPGNHLETPSIAKRSVRVIEQDGGGRDASATHKLSKTSTKSRSQNVEVDHASLPRKKQRLENKNTSSTHAPLKPERSYNPKDDTDRKKAKKAPVPLQQPRTHKDAAKGPKMHKRSSGETQQTSKEAVKSKDPDTKHKKSRGKHAEPPHCEKQKSPKSNPGIPSSSQPTGKALSNRPLFRSEERQYPVKHYIKEAKKLKHKADAESDKLSKAFNYLDAAMYFVESGIAMEKDPHISVSSYTMFAETVELLKFVLKLKNSVDASASPSEKDFLSLCLKCQSLLQMAMFRHKQKTALKYSKTLTDHFSSSTPPDPCAVPFKVTVTPSYIPNMPSPANTSSSSSGLGLDPVSSTVLIPHAIGQVAFNYVNITVLFVSAHDIWEQAEELALKGSGMLGELDAVMGPLSLASSMSSMVSYARQAVHWLRLDSLKGK